MTRERHLVELVDSNGTAIGTSVVEDAHRPPGALHRAFSVLLLDGRNRLLLARRAAAKTRFPLRWANACCGHPAPGVAVATAAAQRLTEELGMAPVGLRELGVYQYRADDPGTGRVEHEYDHVLLGRVGPDLVLRPDPDEVAEVRWSTLSEVRAAMAGSPTGYAPWLSGVLDLLPGGS